MPGAHTAERPAPDAMTWAQRHRRAIVDTALVIAVFWLFQRHLTPSSLFWDEWIYVREIQAAGSSWRWIFTPSTAHVFIPGKALWAAFYETVGLHG